jgi:hypothetical protein
LDVYGTEKDKLDIDALRGILAPMSLLRDEIVDGWTASQVEAHQEVIGWGYVCITLWHKVNIDIKLGNTHAFLETTKRQFKMVAMGNKEIQIKVHIKSFLCGDTTPPPPDHLIMIVEPPSSWPNITWPNLSTLTTRHMIFRSALSTKSIVKAEKKDDISDEAYSMEE